MASDFKEEKNQRRLELLRHKEEEESVAMLAQKYAIPYADISKFPVEIDAIKIVPEEQARAAMLAVFQLSGRGLKIAIRNPENEATTALLKELAGKRYTYDLYLVSAHSLEHAWSYYKKIPKEHESGVGAILISQEKIQSLQKEITNLAEIKERVEKSFHGKTTEALEIILAGALATDASDIHVEPQEKQVRLRFRLDGVLHDVCFLPKNLYALLLSRIKLISELKLNVRDKAQDGRFTIQTQSGDIEVRTSTLPGPEGENIVLRVLNPRSINIPFAELGLHPLVIKTLEAELKKPNGMILTTGPTGSGKTTVLYSFLREIHTPEIKIITLEDPIEYHLEGIEQTQVDTEKGYDFANGLRAIVRQDPDVILVGEIRDTETAETAMNAALTGHLVFSTLHTNNAAGAIPRLIHLGVNPNSIAPALNITMAQRLVRKLCQACRKETAMGEAEKNPDAVSGSRLHYQKTEIVRREKIERELLGFPKNVSVPSVKNWKIFQAAEKGCEFCNYTGYKGRTGVFEIILINTEVEKLVMQSPSEYELQKEAARQGQLTMRQDGLLKVLQGITDFAELERVIGLE